MIVLICAVVLCRISRTLSLLIEVKVEYKVWVCLVCGYEYDEAAGDEEHGLAPGTRWADVPEDWECPECGAGKADFEMVEA